MVILAVASFLVGGSTIKLRKVLGLHATEVGKTQRLITSILLCFGAGVLLSTCMLHILPEVEEGLAEAGAKLDIEWLGELVVCAGFFLVYLVEELAHMMLHRTPHKEHLHKTFSLRKPKGKSNSECNPSQEDRDEKDDHDPHNDMELGSNTLTVPVTTQSANHSHLPVGAQISSMRDFLTILALSFHAVFEGMAVGLEEHTEDVWSLFTAISVHKLVITFTMSLELLQTGPTMFVFLTYLVTFSLVNPVGIGLGMIISHTGHSDGVTEAVFQGLAAGTILYAVMFEILQREKEKNVSGLVQLVAIMVGFSAMMILQILAHHEHDHEEEGEEHDDLGQHPLFRTFINI